MVKFNIEDVLEVFLLSDIEYEHAKAIPVPVERYLWWLRSPGNFRKSVVTVESDGNISYNGYYFDFEFGVRPALRIPGLWAEGCNPGDKILVGEKTVCTVISERVALVDNFVCKRRFDANTNNYETSEIQKYINSPEFLTML